MKNLTISILVAMAIFASFPYSVANAEEVSTSVEMKRSAVTVLPGKAEITRFCTIDIGAGTTLIDIRDFESATEFAGVRVKVTGIGDPILNGVNLCEIPIKPKATINNEEYIKKANELKKEVAWLNKEISVTGYLLDSTEALRKRSIKINSVKSALGSLSLEDQKKKIDFFLAKALEYKQKLRKLLTKKEEASKKLRALASEYSSIVKLQMKTEKVLRLDVIADTPCTASIELKYFVSGCSWSPSYELIYQSGKDSLAVTYIASVTQSTGHDWNDVALTLSTSLAGESIAPKTVRSWNMKLASPMAEAEKSYGYAMLSKSDEKGAEVQERAEASMKRIHADPTGEAMLAVSFSIPDQISVHSGITQQLLVSSFSLDAEITNQVIPLAHPKVFTTAKTRNTSAYPMLAGMAKCFVDGAFTSYTILDRIDINKEAQIPIAYENRIKVKRSEIIASRDEKGSKVRYEYLFRIEIENNSDTEMKLEVRDRIPISLNEDLKIKVKNISPEPYEQSDLGILTWKLNVKKGKTILEIEYYVEFPEGHRLDYTGGYQNFITTRGSLH